MGWGNVIVFYEQYEKYIYNCIIKLKQCLLNENFRIIQIYEWN